MNSFWLKYLQYILLLFDLVVSVSCTDFNDEHPVCMDNCHYDYIVPKEKIDKNKYFINSEADLHEFFANQYKIMEDSMLCNGWKKVENEPLDTRANINIRFDTVYVTNFSVDYYSDPSVYAPFVAHFGAEMVNAINAVADPAYKLSTSKDYICEWRLFSLCYEPLDRERVTSRDSPGCALVPSTKNGFTERGYSSYFNETYNQFVMYSYQLYIKYENVPHKTIVLDIGWPFGVKGPNGIGNKGYEFIYAVSSPA